jgi:uncharacterized protein
MKNPVGWFEIYVQDMGRARKFYESLLGIQLSKLESPGMDMLSFPMQQEGMGAAGALVKMEGMPSGGNSVLVYFMCDDCATEAARAAAAGGHVHKPKTAIGPYGFIALVLDTEGNMVGLHSMK